MMYGFGDVQKPLPETVRVMEEVLLDHVASLVAKSTDLANARRRDRPDISDVLFVIRKDRRKIQRVRYLQEMKAKVDAAKSLTQSLENIGDEVAKPKGR